jgi:dienelactone hydrolase
MNLAGVSVGEMGSRSSDESYDGVPMIFLLREVLVRARDLGQAKEIWRKGPRTCGFNFIFCDPDEICAVEVSRNRIRFFGPGDEGEGTAPHDGIEGVVRRCNHFVDPELAATQRRGYDPRKHAGSSWAAYRRQGDFLKERRGAIDAEAMIALLRGYPVSHPCLHQAVMCPNDRVMWVAQAADPARDPLAGAQNQAFLRYDLRALLAGKPIPARVFSTDRSVSKAVETGLVDGERPLDGYFGHEPREFRYALEPLRNLGNVEIGHLTYPSPGPSLHPENLTVHGEYYRPVGKGPFPSAIVLHILDGRFYVARLVANTLAQRGVAALFVQLPYYGDRRPEGKLDLAEVDVPDVVEGVRQAVRDIRRGAAWLRSRPEVAPDKVGIVGVSLGSFAAQLAAGADGRFDRCVFVLGGGSIAETLFSGSRDTRKAEKLLRERGWDEEKLRAALTRIEPLAVTQGVRGHGGVLMINCRNDEVVPPASTRRYWEAIGKPPIVWYDGGHYALKDHVFDVLRRIGDHFVR